MLPALLSTRDRLVEEVKKELHSAISERSDEIIKIMGRSYTAEDDEVFSKRCKYLSRAIFHINEAIRFVSDAEKTI